MQLANFSARISEDVIIDDGVETSRAFSIVATLPSGQEKTFQLPAAQFAAMSWPTEHLGAVAILQPAAREHMRTAIQILSQRHTRRTVYQHTGWRQTEHGPVYLHAGGAIGARGAIASIETRLSLSDYRLPAPTRESAIAGLRASLEFLDVAAAEVTVPIYAAIWRAILGDPLTFTLHLAGRSGTGKTALAALCQQHFGAGMDAKHLPASWLSTANALEQMGFEANAALFVIDDYVPAGSIQEQFRQNRDADRLLRGQGNNQGRARMTRELDVRPAKPTRALILSTGEDIPRGQSLRARMLILEVAPEHVNWQRMSQAQQAAQVGLYAAATAGFVRWMAARYHETRAQIARELADFRSRMQSSEAHRRTPDNIAELAAGFRVLLSYGRHMDAISATRAEELWQTAGRAFQSLIDMQRSAQESADPTHNFIALCSSAITAGRAHIAARDGKPPESASRWGYRTEGNNTRAQGERIGWTDSTGNVYLEPRAAFATAQRLGREEGEHIPFTLGTLKRRLNQSGMLASTDVARQVVTIRITAEEARRDVLHLNADLFEDGPRETQRVTLDWPKFQAIAAHPNKTKSPDRRTAARPNAPEVSEPQKAKPKPSSPRRPCPPVKAKAAPAETQTLAEIRRHFPNTRAEFENELRAALNGHGDIADETLAATVAAATQSDQRSPRLYLHTVPRLIARAAAAASKPAPVHEIRCSACNDHGTIGASWQMLPEMRALADSGALTFCTCETGLLWKSDYDEARARVQTIKDIRS